MTSDVTLVTRVWHGWTTPENADAYEQQLLAHIQPGIHRVDGYLGAELLRADRGAEVEFVTIKRFDSWEAVRRFAGDGVTAAVVPPAARELLSRFDEHSEQYLEVVRVSDRGAIPKRRLASFQRSEHSRRSMIKLLMLGLTILAAAPLAGASIGKTRVHTLPGAKAFPESIGADKRTGAFFTGSVLDGTVYRGTLDEPESQVFLPAGSDGRTNVAGVKVDNQSRVWLADAYHGRVLVYSEDGQLLHVFDLAGPGPPTVNDIAFSHGVAYITDSARPFLYRVQTADAAQAGTTTVEPWLDVSPTVAYKTGQGPLGVNLNGIVASDDGKTLVLVQTNTGTLFRVDADSGHISTVAVTGSELLYGDGLLRVGSNLYVARNAVNEIVKLHLARDWRSAKAVEQLTNKLFAFPTALAALDGRLLVTNAQLDKAGGAPQLPFTVVDLPLGGAETPRWASRSAGPKRSERLAGGAPDRSRVVRPQEPPPFGHCVQTFVRCPLSAPSAS